MDLLQRKGWKKMIFEYMNSKENLKERTHQAKRMISLYRALVFEDD